MNAVRACKAAWAVAFATFPIAGGAMRAAYASEAGVPPQREVAPPAAAAAASQHPSTQWLEMQGAESIRGWAADTPGPEEIAEQEWQGELELLAALVYAEAHTEDLAGKRLVADVVLNRVDSPLFPDTIAGVVMQERQFATWASGKVEAAGWLVGSEEYEAVGMEAHGERLDRSVLYFTAGHYNASGTPAYRHGNHYFSTR